MRNYEWKKSNRSIEGGKSLYTIAPEYTMKLNKCCASNSKHLIKMKFVQNENMSKRILNEHIN